MITNKNEYLLYLKEDQKALGSYTKYPLFSNNIMVLLTDPCWKFQKLLRKLEYWTNCKKNNIYIHILRWQFKRMSINMGFTIPINVFEEGLCIVHYGSIIVSRHAKVGKNCTINSGVNIGENVSIGDRCYLAPGAKLFNVRIGNNVKIGANAVVNKSFEKDNVILAGVPAKIVKYISEGYKVMGEGL